MGLHQVLGQLSRSLEKINEPRQTINKDAIELEKQRIQLAKETMMNERRNIENKGLQIRLDFMKFIVENEITQERLVLLTEAADAFVAKR